jgi:c-di-AMP phosphodiesterase-like protein
VNRNLKRLVDSGVVLYFFFLAAFAIAAWFFGEKLLAEIEGGITLVLLIIALVTSRRKRKQLTAYIESVMYETDNAKSNTLMSFPLPIVVFRLDDSRIIWGNEMFFEMCGTTGTRLDASINDLVPQFSGKWLLEGKNRYGSLIELGGRKYQLHGNIIRSANDEADGAFMGITYWVDVTEHDDLRILYEESRPVAAVIVIDNWDELTRNQPERGKNDLREAIEDQLTHWSEERSAILRRYERDRYLAVFEKKDTDRMREERFGIIEAIHAVENPVGIAASISIGLGEDAASLGEALQFADNAAELALSRGGDQAVIKNRHGYEFFGGRGNEVETRTKVKSRVMANAFAELVKDSTKVFVMGHKFADLDTVGAAAGVVCLARKFGKRASIVIDLENNAAGELIGKLRQEEEYASVFISTQEAMLRADTGTLLVVVDTNRPEQAEDADLLAACTRVAVIDHHRVAATYIQNSALSFIEPYASSACELITELLQEVVERQDIRHCEAEAMLAGMVLDTKSFTVRTGERTFEAAAYLRRSGADTTEVKKLLQSDMDTTIARYNVLTSAKLYRNIAIASPTEPQTRIVAAQAADELLNISGVDASLVMAPDGKGGAFISARSIGDVNVQILMEKLGGGGNRSVAAAQFEKMDIETLYQNVKDAIDDYYK